MSQFSIGYKVVKETFSTAWQKKELWVYPFLGYLAAITATVLVAWIIGLILGIKIPGHLLSGLGWKFYVLRFLVTFTLSFVLMIFVGAFFTRLYALGANKKSSFGDSFSFERGAILNVFFYVILNQIVNAAWWFHTTSADYMDVEHNLISGLSFKINMAHVRILGLIWLVTLFWWFSTYLVLPMIFKKNDSIWKLIVTSFKLMWRNFIVSLIALLSMFVFFCIILGIVGLFTILVIWVCKSILGLTLTVWSGGIIIFICGVIPGLISLLYISTVGMALSLYLYLELNKSKK